jgi:2-polyprenyl-3-methyl-5-hydroxy-6-metoxy-1,4-benzoquinol methylase
MEFRKVQSKSQLDITAEWDALAPVRFQQITSHQDYTFWQILVPSVFAMLKLTKADSIIDAGCGVGVLSDLLSKDQKKVVGIDPSAKSIFFAQKFVSPNARFVVTTLEDYAKRNVPSVSVVIANMVLMDVIDLQAFLSAAFDVLRPNGSLIFTITHPFFWSEYYGYSAKPWFHYEQEAIIESPFRITSQPDCRLNSTHVHRPLETYLNVLFESGFVTELLQEPMPSHQVAQMYKKPWQVPRYLVGLARRENSIARSRSRRENLRRKGIDQ